MNKVNLKKRKSWDQKNKDYVLHKEQTNEIDTVKKKKSFFLFLNRNEFSRPILTSNLTIHGKIECSFNTADDFP